MAGGVKGYIVRWRGNAGQPCHMRFKTHEDALRWMDFLKAAGRTDITMAEVDDAF